MKQNEASVVDSFLTPASTNEGAGKANESLDGEVKATLKERAARIYKQHLEIVRLKK